MGKQTGPLAVALSGGVDSAVAALLLIREGWQVVGVHLQLAAGCPVPERLESLARHLGIRLLTLDARQAFAREVVDYFVRSYSRGETPNPCIRCNAAIKFGVLREFLASQGFGLLATGHYVRREERPDGEVAVLRGRDRGKDQSYFLQRLPRELLPLLRFPLGDLTKTEVRRLFAEMDLPLTDGCPESQDLCFLGEQHYGDFLREKCGAGVPGELVDPQGRVLGRHRGVACYTVGQRRGLGVPGPVPYYVLAIRPEANQVVIGPREHLFANGLTARFINWLISPPIKDLPVTAVIRYRHPGVAATVSLTPEGAALVRFSSPQSAVTPGQGVAFYEGPRLLGGGWIEGAVTD